MRRKKLFSTAILMILILSKYEADAAGFNGHKSSDNPKDLQIIHDKFTIGREQTIEIVKKLTTTMKQEQKGFETELDAFLKATPNAPVSMKKMLSDQKEMQAEVEKLATDVQKYKGHFEKWLGDVKNLKTKDNMTIYEGMKPFIRELDPMTDKFKTYTQKFIDHAKRYREFGQSMLDSGFVDTTVNKRLCSLGKVIEETGFHVSDVGDPIAIAADKIGDIWQRTNPRDKDNSLVQISKKLVPKAQELVSDGDKQATDRKKVLGTMLEGMGAKIKGFVDIGKRIWDDDQSKMSNIVEILKKIGGRIRSKGSEVNVCGRKLQNLGVCTPNDGKLSGLNNGGSGDGGLYDDSETRMNSPSIKPKKSITGDQMDDLTKSLKNNLNIKKLKVGITKDNNGSSVNRWRKGLKGEDMFEDENQEKDEIDKDQDNDKDKKTVEDEDTVKNEEEDTVIDGDNDTVKDEDEGKNESKDEKNVVKGIEKREMKKKEVKLFLPLGMFRKRKVRSIRIN